MEPFQVRAPWLAEALARVVGKEQASALLSLTLATPLTVLSDKLGCSQPKSSPPIAALEHGSRANPDGARRGGGQRYSGDGRFENGAHFPQRKGPRLVVEQEAPQFARNLGGKLTKLGRPWLWSGICRGCKRSGHVNVIRENLAPLHEVEQPFQMPAVEGFCSASTLRPAKQFPQARRQKVERAAVLLHRIFRNAETVSTVSALEK